MLDIAVTSSKGGTGKRGLTASFAYLAKTIASVDCDVDVPDLHLMFSIEVTSTEEYYGNKKAFIDPDPCTGFGQRIPLCRFTAIDDTFVVDPLDGEGCDVCARFCSSNAIEMRDHIAEHGLIPKTSLETIVHAKPGIGAENSGKLVTYVKRKVQNIHHMGSTAKLNSNHYICEENHV